MVRNTAADPPTDGGYPADTDLHQMTDDGGPLTPDPARWDDPTWRDAMAGQRRGRVTLAVPWDRAGAARDRLAREGHPATLCLNARTRTAGLELWSGVDPAAAAAALDEMLTAGPLGG